MNTNLELFSKDYDFNRWHTAMSVFWEQVRAEDCYDPFVDDDNSAPFGETITESSEAEADQKSTCVSEFIDWLNIVDDLTLGYFLTNYNGGEHNIEVLSRCTELSYDRITSAINALTQNPPCYGESVAKLMAEFAQKMNRDKHNLYENYGSDDAVLEKTFDLLGSIRPEAYLNLFQIADNDGALCYGSEFVSNICEIWNYCRSKIYAEWPNRPHRCNHPKFIFEHCSQHFSPELLAQTIRILYRQPPCPSERLEPLDLYIFFLSPVEDPVNAQYHNTVQKAFDILGEDFTLLFLEHADNTLYRQLFIENCLSEKMKTVAERWFNI